MRMAWPVGLVFALSACSDEVLQSLNPELVITAYTNGQSYSIVDNDNRFIDLGVVPVHASKWAIFELSNPTGQLLTVKSIKYTSTFGGVWDAPIVEPEPGPRFQQTTDLDFTIAPAAKALLRIRYAPTAPTEIQQHEVAAVIESDAANGTSQTVTVKADSIFTGEPDIEVEYGTYRGPAREDCVDVDEDGTIDGCTIPASNALDFGNIGLGGQGSVRLVLRNRAECTPFEGVDRCGICTLSLRPDEMRANVGIALVDNDDGFFDFQGSIATPVDIRQASVDCSATGEVRLLLTFNAPASEGIHEARILIESTDRDEPLIEIPVRGSARNAPVAIADFRTFDAAHPSEPYTDPTAIRPLERVYFDGRRSFDTIDPTNPALLAAWEWEVIEAPSGADRGRFAFHGEETSLFDFWLPIAGHYVVGLTVWNTAMLQSGDTPESRVEFDVVPGSRLHVQLTWDDPTNDQDLHLTDLSQTKCSAISRATATSATGSRAGPPRARPARVRTPASTSTTCTDSAPRTSTSIRLRLAPIGSRCTTGLTTHGCRPARRYASSSTAYRRVSIGGRSSTTRSGR